MTAMKLRSASLGVVAVVFFTVVSTLHGGCDPAIDPETYTPCDTSEVCVDNACVPAPPACDNACEQVSPGSGQEAIDANPPSVSSAVELDAIRLEIIALRRYVVILGGIFFGWAITVYLYRYHS
jgi:hypothetical protein